MVTLKFQNTLLTSKKRVLPSLLFPEDVILRKVVKTKFPTDYWIVAESKGFYVYTHPLTYISTNVSLNTCTRRYIQNWP